MSSIHLPEYELAPAPFHESRNSIVLRGRRAADNAQVVIKLLRTEYPTPHQLVAFRREFEILRSLSGELVVSAYKLFDWGRGLGMVVEDFGGDSLALQAMPLPIDTFFQVALRLCDALEHVHSAGIIHRDVTPMNVVWNRSTGVLKLIDFGISTALPREMIEVRRPELLEGTLLYISPEQTGRMNCGVDYRTDLYALGATLYFALTGRPPFISDDPLELVHAHLALAPKPPHEINPAVPAQVSAVVLKLLAKAPNARYQSAMGLRSDLLRCLAGIEASGAPAVFALGTDDVSERFMVCEKLVGREAEVAQLLAAFERCAAGGVELLGLPGPPGIGKSALVAEVHRPITGKCGFFAQGKFDQLNRGVPFSAVLQAFRGLLRQILSSGEAQLARWAALLRGALGPNARAVADVVPELNLILGETAPLPESSTLEALNRFKLTFQAFVQALAQADHPLVLFLDDLQWADTPSLQLIEQFASGAAAHHILVLGAWRDNEVDASHPLARTLSQVEKRGGRVQQVRVDALNEDDVAQVVATTLCRDVSEVTDLATLCAKKTGGNPFFLGQILRALHADRHIAFDRRVRGFAFDLESIRQVGITENVVELMADKMQRMPERTQRALQRAACIGNRFDIGLLSIVAGMGAAGTRQSVAAALWPALEQGLVVPVDGAYKFVDDADTETFVEYRFVHDRVQRAAYDLIPPEGRSEIHLEIGRVLLAHTEADPAARAEKLFDIAGHFLHARALLTGDQERARVGHIAHEAGRRAMTSAAFAPAWRYLHAAIELAGPRCWEVDYAWALELRHLGAEAALLASDLPSMERIVDEVLERGRTPLDRARAYETRLTARMIQSRMPDAVSVGRQLLADLGLRYPANPGLPHFLAGAARTRLAVGNRPAASLGVLRTDIDPLHGARMRALMFVSPAAYNVLPMLLPLLIFDYIQLTIQQGLVPEGVYGFVNYGFLLAGHLGDYRRGLDFAQFALDLVERPENRRVYARTVLVAHWFVMHWSRPLRQSLDPYVLAWSVGLETGDVEFGVYAALSRTVVRLIVGDPLPEVAAEAAVYLDTYRRLESATGERRGYLFLQFAHDLMGLAKDPAVLRDEVFNSRDPNPDADPQLPPYTLLCELWVATLRRQYPDALRANDALAKRKDPIIGSPVVPMSRYLAALAECALLPERSGIAWVAARARIEGHLHALRGWAAHAPSNREHHVLLVEAERARVLGEPQRAAERYDRAIDRARANGFLNDEALACELAGEFYFSTGRARLASSYLRDARHLWQRWGAKALVDALDRRHPAEISRGKEAAGTVGTTTGELDLGTVLKASDALAGEIELSALIGRVMRVTLENAGASRGVLVLYRNGVPHVEVEQHAVAGEQPQMLRVPLPAEGAVNAPLPVSLVRYALRTGDPVVLEDASQDGAQFSSDPYVKVHRPRAVLALPLMKQGRAVGALYLENSLNAGVFGPDRLALLRVLASQAAISLENALLYEGLQQSLHVQVELTQANERFVPREFLAALGHASIAGVALGDSVQKEMTVLFSDMRAFTSHVEGQSPGENIAFINDYLSDMEPAIFEAGGFVDSYIGDAILALFDVAPAQAVRAGLGMLRRLRDYNARRRARGLAEVQIGVGVNSGILTLGTMGGPQRLRCGVIGDPVNLSARIESLTKHYGVALLVSDDTMRLLPSDHGFSCREVDRVRVAGRKRPVTLYEVYESLDGDGMDARTEVGIDWDRALRACESRDFASGLELFRRVEQRLPKDPVVRLRIARCAKHLATPPGDEWDGVEVLTNK